MNRNLIEGVSLDGRRLGPAERLTYRKDNDISGWNGFSAGVPLCDSCDGEKAYGRRCIKPCSDPIRRLFSLAELEGGVDKSPKPNRTPTGYIYEFGDGESQGVVTDSQMLLFHPLSKDGPRRS